MYKVLIVEDNQAVQRDIEKLIHQAGEEYQVVGKMLNGVQGLEFLRKTEVDIVVTDIQMSVMNGLEFIERCRSTFPNIFFMIISGYDEFEYARTAMRLNVHEYILKPVDPQDFKEALKRTAAEADASALRNQPIFSENELKDLLKLKDVKTAEGYKEKWMPITERLEKTIIRWDKKAFLAELEILINQWMKRGDTAEEISGFLMGINELIISKKHCQNEFDFAAFVRNIMFLSHTYNDLKASTGEFYSALFDKIDTLVLENKYTREMLFKKMTDYLQEHIYGMINMQDMKEYFGMSESYMSRVFKQYAQISPMVYYSNLKIEEAKKIMDYNSSIKIGEIAEMLGYSNQYYFSKAFKWSQGMSPQEYKKLKMDNEEE